MRCPKPAALTAALLVAAIATPALAGEARTIRVEPRGFYGATVTLEEGVRVFRPLPRHKYVIVNPGNAAPINLTIKDDDDQPRISNTNTVNNFGTGGGGFGAGGVIGTPFGFGHGKVLGGAKPRFQGGIGPGSAGGAGFGRSR